jgi:hypothetical protein
LEGDLGLGIVLVRAQIHIRRTVDATYLTVVCRGIDVKNDQEKYHVDESGQACNRIDLPKETDKPRAVQRNLTGNASQYGPLSSSGTADALE